MSPIPKATQQEMARSAFCPSPRAPLASSSLSSASRVNGENEGGPGLLGPQRVGWGDKGLCLAGSLARIKEQEGPMSQGEERTASQGVMLEDGRLGAKCFSARFPPQPHVATQEGCWVMRLWGD